MMSNPIRSALRRAERMLRRTATSLEEIAEGGEPTATPPRDAAASRLGDPDRETSTNAQMEGAADEPWSGNR
jgi:hypothetical protein